MSKQAKNGLVPVLRFSEFRNTGEWNTEELGDKTSKVGSGITPKGGDKNYKALGRPFVRSQNIGWGILILEDVAYIDEATHSTFLSTEIAEGDVLLNITGASIGRSAVANRSIKGGNVNQHVCIIRTKTNKLTPFFLNQFLLSQNGQNQIDSFQAGGNRQGLNFAQIRSFSVPLPPKIEEQQKIADCLSSIDELVAAQTQKVEALKAHKNGLMQQLFPAEGETVPKLRFPEFREAGEWEEINLGSIGKISMCKRILKDETRPYGDIPFYKIGTFGKQADAYISREVYESYKSKYSYPKKGDILISASGTIGRLVVFDGAAAYFQDSNIVWIDNNESLVKNAFLFYCYKSIKWATDNNTIARLYNDNLSGMKIFITSIPEQQKIAACLSSLDELITAQTQKLTALNAHKKGLMQQLFPVVDEVNG